MRILQTKESAAVSGGVVVYRPHPFPAPIPGPAPPVAFDPPPVVAPQPIYPVPVAA